MTDAADTSGSETGSGTGSETGTGAMAVTGPEVASGTGSGAGSGTGPAVATPPGGQATAPDAAARQPILRPGDTCWRTERADRFAVIVDAADYFVAARRAMMAARHSIVLVGWDFDLRIDLAPDGADDDMPTELGDFLKALVRRTPDLRISILKWDMAVLYTLGTQMLPRLALDLYSVRRIRMRFDSTHPTGAAHHQKIAVIDDALAFCGGIDMTTDRWDTRGHRPGDPRRTRPDGSRSGPWHDATTVLDGPAARALGELCRARWRDATGQRLRPPRREGESPDLWPEGARPDLWPEGVRPQLRDVEVGIARTMPAYHGRQAIREIEALYRAAIAAARRCIYLESQYFASASICEAIARRLREPDGPEVVVVNPLSTFGWLEERTMGSARDLRLQELREADRHGRFAIFHPVDAAGAPIYVHAKVLVVDDRLIRVGSSNVNNRSMGFDTECDLAVEAADAEEAATIRAIRDDLLAEHLDHDPQEVRGALARTGSLLATVEALRRNTGRSLRPLPRDPPGDLGIALSRSRLADPERPRRPETLIAHAAKRIALRLPTSVWIGAGLGLAAAAGAAVACRRRGRD